MTVRRKKDETQSMDSLNRLEERLEAIERQVHLLSKETQNNLAGEQLAECCGLPVVPLRPLEDGIDPGRESLIRAIEKKWVNGTELRYYFYDRGRWKGNKSQNEIVREAFDEWKSIGIGLSFREVSSPTESDIRIGFLRGDGSWSYVGRDIWSQSLSERTMNFGWKLAGDDGRDTALHEIGHTLGFNHEQMNPFAPIEWDEDAVYRYFTGPPNNWSRSKTFHNVLRTLAPSSVEGSNWDPDSIMQYEIPAGLISRPEEYRVGLVPAPGLSDTDIDRALLFYPSIEEKYEELEVLKAYNLKLGPAEQANLAIRPRVTRQYQIQTFGTSDTLMVLFEDNEGTLEHFAADDDSGWNRNASLDVRLVRGREYVLRVRQYLNGGSGESAIMMW